MIRVLNEGTKAVIEIDGNIGENWFIGEGHTLKSIKAQIEAGDYSEVIVNIKSDGGDLIEGFAMFDYLKGLSAKVTARLTGLVASAATIVAMAADEREITPNARFMIHRSATATFGNEEAHEKAAQALKRFDDDIINTYRKVTGKRKSEIAALMKEERLLTAQEAVEWGFVNRITKEKINNQIVNKMEIFKSFNVANEAELQAKFENMAADRDGLKEQLTEKQQQIETLTAEVENFIKQRNETIVSNAIESGRIGEAQKDVYLNLLKADYENTKKAIEALQKPANLVDYVNGKGETKADQKDYDWYVKNDAQALIKMQKEHPEQYQKLVENKRKGK